MEEKYSLKQIPEQLPDELGTVGIKAAHSVIICAIAGIALIVCLRNLFGFLMGGFFLVLAGVVQFKQKDRKVMTVCKDVLYLYDSDYNDQAICLPLEDIAEWCVNKNGNYSIVFKLKDGEQFAGQSFQVNKAVKLLKQVMPNKSLEHLQMERMKQMRKEKKK